MKRIGVLTSGGDAPGMNACVRAVVRTATFHNIEVVGIYEGYQGMIRGEIKELSTRDVGGIIQQGGTILQTARSQEFRTKQGQREAIRELNENEIDGVVVIGGDGSLNGARALASYGVKVIGVPASIDNDISGTEMSIGVDTALNTIIHAIDQLRDTASSHNRAFIIETMGRNCGYLAQVSAIISGAEMVLLPEVEVDIQAVAKVIEDSYIRGKNHAIIVVAEGALTRATVLAQELKDLDVGFHTRVTILGHIQRGGRPTAFDRLLATRLGAKAVESLIEGQTDVMTGLKCGEIQLVPLEDVLSETRNINVRLSELFNRVA
ncbi:6-phosphofructokinase [bacterium]|nr:6-phosphofructokinase [bacterium]